MPPEALNIRLHAQEDLAPFLPRWAAYVQRRQTLPSRHPGWLAALAKGLKHKPYCVEALLGGQLVGLLPLCYVRSLLFGRFLVSLPYLNTGGVLADDEKIAMALIDRAVELADRLKVRHLELRHEKPIEHPALTQTLTTKVHMRLALPSGSERLWKDFDPKVRNQIRKGEKAGLTVHWGSRELLGEFYAVFARNMRNLGTPVFGRKLFDSILLEFAGDAELCVVPRREPPDRGGPARTRSRHNRGARRKLPAKPQRDQRQHVHVLASSATGDRAGPRGVRFRPQFARQQYLSLQEAVGRGTAPAAWQYYVRQGSASDMRRESGKYDRMVRVWRRLPLPVTRWIGPSIVRGIP